MHGNVRRIGKGGRFNIPEHVLESLGFEDGDLFEFNVSGSAIVIKKFFTKNVLISETIARLEDRIYDSEYEYTRKSAALEELQKLKKTLQIE